MGLYTKGFQQVASSLLIPTLLKRGFPAQGEPALVMADGGPRKNFHTIQSENRSLGLIIKVY
jgi:hypothetical protein